MINGSFVLSDKITIERYGEGALISAEDSSKVICLGNFECDLLDIALNNNFSKAIHILQERYQGSDIEEDFEEFCMELYNCGVLCKKEV